MTKKYFNKTGDQRIGWAKYSWNPVTGCSNNCKYCYARDRARRFHHLYPNGFEPMFHPSRLLAPSNTKLPASAGKNERIVFVCSMSDLFGDWVPQSWIDQILSVCAQYPQWIYMFLTKYPKNLIRQYWPRNIWVGTTVDCQDKVAPAVEAFTELNKSPYRPDVLFVSCEPMNERIDFGEDGLKVFEWVIIGSRSGSTSMPAFQPKLEWIESLHSAARKAGCKIYDKPNLKVAGLSINPKEFP